VPVRNSSTPADAPAQASASVPTKWEKPPAVVTACATEVHVWRIRADEQNVVTLWASLSGAERERARSFRSQASQREFVIGIGALRSILGNYLRVIPQAVEFIRGQHGKPELAPRHARSGLRFNLSHSHGLILEAISLKEVGVDVEFIQSEVSLSEVGARVLSPLETLLVSQRPAIDRQRGFFQCWTRKEAFAKGFGEGLSDSVTQFDILPSASEGIPMYVRGVRNLRNQWVVMDLNAADGFAAALAVADRNCTVRLWDWTSCPGGAT
jgi:4'-phosphopantetheinyl transferase